MSESLPFMCKLSSGCLKVPKSLPLGPHKHILPLIMLGLTLELLSPFQVCSFISAEQILHCRLLTGPEDSALEV